MPRYIRKFAYFAYNSHDKYWPISRRDVDNGNKFRLVF